MLNTAVLTGLRPLGIALSGGSDSTALLLLAVQHLGAAQLRAVTVDHGLRAGAAREALAAKTLCDSLGVPHDTLEIAVAPGGDLQARARDARYRALARWAQRTGVQATALGHTRDDVAETFLMRLARGSGVDGLAGMPPGFERFGCHFVRPLLDAGRSELRDFLRAGGTLWSEDPSNGDTRYARAQMRRAMPDLAAVGLTRDRLAQTAHWMQAASQVLEDAAQAWIAQHAAAEHGDAVLDHAALHAAREETALRVLARALCGISQNPYRPRLNALKTLWRARSAVTLHGCLAYPVRGALRITREYEAARRDNSRWHVSGPLLEDHHLAPLGPEGLAQIIDWRNTALLPRRSLLASPAIWQGNTLVAAPLAKPSATWRASAPNPLHLAN